MSSIHVKVLVEALNKPSTLKALVRKTGYPADKVLHFIAEARAEGHAINCRMRGERYSDDIKPVLFEVR